MRSLAIVLMLGVLACGKTSTSTPEKGSGTGTPTPTVTTTDAGTPVTVMGSGSGSATGDLFDQSIAQLDGLKAKMCACKDTSCSAKVFDEYKLWRLDMKKAITGKKPSKAQEERGNVLDKELTTCRKNVEAGVTNLGSAGSASGDPMDLALVELDGFKAKMCACPNKACADKVQEDVKTWERLMRAKLTQKPSQQQQAKGKLLENEMKECRKKAETATPGAPGGGEKIDAMLVKMGSLKDKLCACKDKPCGAGVQKEMEVWLEGAAKDLADAKPTKDQDAKSDKIEAEIKACAAKLQ